MPYPRPAAHARWSDVWAVVSGVGGILGLVALALTAGFGIVFINYYLTDGSSPLAVTYCSRACLPGEVLVSTGSCVDCVNLLSGTVGSITTTNTLACSGFGTTCPVTKGAGTNLTIAALAESGLVTLTSSNGVITISAELPSDVLPLCGACATGSTLRLASSGLCYECYTVAASGLVTVTDVGSVRTIGAALPTGTLALCGSCPAQSTLKIATNGSCYECYTPTLSCPNGDVCGVLDGSGDAMLLNGYVAGSGVTITNTTNGTEWGLDLVGVGITVRDEGASKVVEQDLGDTSGDLHAIWRNAEPLRYTSPWMYADTVPSLGGTGPTQVPTLVMVRTWVDTTVDVTAANLSAVIPRGVSWNNTLVMDIHYNFVITYDGSTPSVGTFDFSAFAPAGVVTTNIQGTGSCMDIINPPLTGLPTGTIYAGPLNQVIAVIGVGNGGSYSSYVVCQMETVMLLNSTAPTSNPWDGHLPA